ncbi:unnamed protein product, partial [Hapterophycus canaliculatus]
MRGNINSASALEPVRPRDTLVQDYLGREGAEQFLSDWDEERSSASSSVSFSSSTPPSPPVSIVPPGGGSGGSKGKSGTAVAGSAEAVPPRSKPQASLSPVPRQALPQEAVHSSTDGSPPPLHEPNGAGEHCGTLKSGVEEPCAAAVAGTYLGDPALERWAASMVALGKAVVARATPGKVTDAQAQDVLGSDLPFAAARSTPEEARR